MNWQSLNLAILLLLVFATAPTGFAQELEEGFEPLCNGKDLDGWVAMNGADFVCRDGMIVATGGSNWPSWLRSEEVFENFVLRLEFRTYYGGESGIYFAAPTEGRIARIGYEFQIGGTRGLSPHSTGAIFDAVAPLRAAPKRDDQQEYHDLEISMNWPKLKVTLNGHVVQDVDCRQHPQLRYKQRLGHIGFQSRGKRTDFRNVRIKRLPDQIRDEWQPMLNGKDLAGWSVSENCSADWEVDKDGVLSSVNGHGYLISDDEFYNFEWKCFVKTTFLANGGIFFDWQTNRGRGFEVQIEDILDSNDPTGSIYGRVRASQIARKQGEWSLLHVILNDNTCVVRIDGQTVATSEEMTRRRWGNVSLQMHKNNATIFWKNMQIRKLPSPPQTSE